MRFSAGAAVAFGGVCWLTGVGVLEALTESVEDSLPLAFYVLAVVAGGAVGAGMWGLARRLDGTAARWGARVSSVAATAIALGFALDNFGGFLLTYTAILFIAPLGFLVLGVGLIRSRELPLLGRLSPFVGMAGGMLTYGFHAVAPDVWDPPDSVWFIVLGVSWIAIGISALPLRRLADGGGTARPA